MTNDQKRRRISAIATNAVAAAMDAKAGRMLMTDHDAETRDAIFALLMGVQETEQTLQSVDSVPMVAPTQGKPDARLDLVFEALEAAE